LTVHYVRRWTKQELTILLDHIFSKKINCIKLQEMGILRKNRGISLKWRSMKIQIKKLFEVDL
ncbi:10831_t:CDS:1, partial [Entrophospora sp. SA101]